MKKKKYGMTARLHDNWNHDDCSNCLWWKEDKNQQIQKIQTAVTLLKLRL